MMVLLRTEYWPHTQDVNIDPKYITTCFYEHYEEMINLVWKYVWYTKFFLQENMNIKT